MFFFNMFVLLFWTFGEAKVEKIVPQEVIRHSNHGSRGENRFVGNSVEGRGSHIPLPWQISLFGLLSAGRRPALFSGTDDFQNPQLVTMHDNDYELVIPNSISQAVSKVFSLFCRFSRHRSTSLNLLIKSSLYSSVTFYVFKRVEVWFKGISKYKICLDKIDVDIADYGFHLRRLGAAVGDTLATEAREGYIKVGEKIILNLGSAYGAGGAEDYISRISRDVASFLSEMDFVANVSAPLRAKDSLEIIDSKFSDIPNAKRNIHNPNIHKGVAILQARQADLSLRQARSKLLRAVSTCDDLTMNWKFVTRESQNDIGRSRSRFNPVTYVLVSIRKFVGTVLKYPRSRLIMRRHSGQVYPLHSLKAAAKEEELQGIDKRKSAYVRNSYAHGKLLAIERLREYLYSCIGQIQGHLDRLQPIEEAIVSLSETSTRSTIPYANQEQWMKLDEWAVDAYILATHCLSRSFKSDNETIGANKKLKRIHAKGSEGAYVTPKISSPSDVRENETDSHDIPDNSEIKEYLIRTRTLWKLGTIVARDISDDSSPIATNLENIGFQLNQFGGERRSDLFSAFSLANSLRLLLLGCCASTGIHLARYGRDLSVSVRAATTNIRNFLDRRLLGPTHSIINDVLLNRRVSLTDKDALMDSKRSLTVMIDDFLRDQKPKLTERERKLLASRMDMTPLSLEYERELNRPIQNLLSGRIARLVLIQLQFVKKELLVAMQAIDDLFNANQVNLQLLAVTPVIMVIISLNTLSRAAFKIVRTTSKGRLIESSKIISSNLREGVRNLERITIISAGVTQKGMMTDIEFGEFISVLYNIQDLLVINKSNFDSQTLRQLQEDLRDLTMPSLNIQQRLRMIECLSRRYVFLIHPARKSSFL